MCLFSQLLLLFVFLYFVCLFCFLGGNCCFCLVVFVWLFLFGCLCLFFGMCVCFWGLGFLFNDTFNTFYLWLYGVRHIVKDHSDSEV